MRLFLFALVAGLAGCAASPPDSAPPASGSPPADPEPVVEAPVESAVVADPLADVPLECRPDVFGQVFSFRVASWLESAGTLLGCPQEALDVPEWQLVENRTMEAVDGMTRVRVPDPNDSELEVAFDVREGRIVRATRWMTPDAQRVVSFYRLEAALAPDRLGDAPVLQTDSRQVFAPSDARPFWTDFYRTPDAIVLQISDAPDLAPDLDSAETAAEADDLAAGGRACDAPFEPGREAFLFSDFEALTARLGCPYEQALADLGLADPAETLEAPDGSVVYSFTGTSRILPALVVSAQRKADRLAALMIQWPGEANRHVSFLAARTKALGYTGEAPDLDEEARAMWFDDDDLRVGIVVEMGPGGATLQLIDARWF